MHLTFDAQSSFLIFRHMKLVLEQNSKYANSYQFLKTTIILGGKCQFALFFFFFFFMRKELW